MTERDSQILKIAVPSIVSNITVPLLGLIDVAIVGHMGDAVYIGAVAVGSMIFSLLYWLFAFLRMGTSGMTSQALGRRDLPEVGRLLVSSITVAFAVALLIIIFQVPMRWLMFWLIGPTADVAPFATTYYYIAVWGAPASLGLFSFTGWYIGMQNTRIPMFISIMQNIVNILASLTLVYGFGMKIEGVALGTVIAQYAGLLAAILLLIRYYGRMLSKHLTRMTTSYLMLRRMFSVNRDIFLRTLCLVAVNLYFTSAGARLGAVILSVNTVFMQLYLFYSYFIDGFAFAGEAIGGRYYGARNDCAFSDTLRHLFRWAAAVALLYTLAYIFGGQGIVNLLTDEPHVRQAATVYVWWIWLVPVASTLAFIWDGIFIGITATRGMLISSFIAALMFFAVYLITKDSLGNHGLWLALIVYLLMRGIIQTVWFRQKTLPFFREQAQTCSSSAQKPSTA